MAVDTSNNISNRRDLSFAQPARGVLPVGLFTDQVQNKPRILFIILDASEQGFCTTHDLYRARSKVLLNCDFDIISFDSEELNSGLIDFSNYSTIVIDNEVEIERINLVRTIRSKSQNIPIVLAVGREDRIPKDERNLYTDITPRCQHFFLSHIRKTLRKAG